MRIGLIATMVFLAGPVLAAGDIEQACLARSGQKQAMCACSQSAANMTLSADDQRTAAKMIAQPDLYYDYAESSRDSRRAFIKRFDIWGDTVAQLCSLEG
jgi:hypothetical protein